MSKIRRVLAVAAMVMLLSVAIVGAASATETYTVTFAMQGHGEQVASQEIAEGGMVTNPGVSSESGYTFGGWYKDYACVTLWDFSNDTVDYDTTIYAKWTLTESGTVHFPTTSGLTHHMTYTARIGYDEYATGGITGVPEGTQVTVTAGYTDSSWYVPADRWFVSGDVSSVEKSKNSITFITGSTGVEITCIETNVWNGSSSTACSGSPYQIVTAANMKWFLSSGNASSSYVIYNDFDFGGYTLPAKGSFGGSLDGGCKGENGNYIYGEDGLVCRYILKNTKINGQGFFTSLAQNAKISNVETSGCKICTNARFGGGLIGQIQGRYVTVMNCYVHDGSVISSYEQTGGLLGIINLMQSGGDHILFKDCKVEREYVSGSSDVAAFVGHGGNTNESGILYENCKVISCVVCGYKPSGFVGQMGYKSSVSYVRCTVDNTCIIGSSSCPFIGLFGNVSENNALVIDKCAVRNCTLYSPIVTEAGGIIGKLNASASGITITDVTLENCCFNVPTGSTVGGIVAKVSTGVLANPTGVQYNNNIVGSGGIDIGGHTTNPNDTVWNEEHKQTSIENRSITATNLEVVSYDLMSTTYTITGQQGAAVWYNPTTKLIETGSGKNCGMDWITTLDEETVTTVGSFDLTQVYDTAGAYSVQLHLYNPADSTGVTIPASGITFKLPTNSYLVTYNANGATSGTVPVPQFVTKGDSVTVSGNVGGLWKPGFVFSGWQIDGTGTVYGPGYTETFTPEGNVVLYASWIPGTLVILDKNSGDNNPVPGTVPEIYESAVAGVTFTTAAKCSGYTLDGWYTESSGGSKILNADGTYSGVKNIAGWIDEDGKWINESATATLYAKWIGHVSYDANGATSGTAPVDSGNPHTSGDPVTVSGNTGGLTKTDCAFVGWTCDQELTTTGGPIPAGNLIPVDTVFTMPSGNVTLYARWMPVTIVTLDKNSGDNNPVPGTVTEIYGYAVAGVTFTTAAKCSGYTLDGWYTESSGGSKILNADGTYSGVKNIAGWIDEDGKWINSNTTATLYAHWTDALKYYVYIPSGVTLQSTPVEGTYKIKILSSEPGDERSVVLRYSSSAHESEGVKHVTLSGDSSEKMPYTVTLLNSSTDIQPGTKIVSVPATGTSEETTLTYSGVDSTGRKAGLYSDTLTFTVAVEKEIVELDLGGATWYDEDNVEINKVYVPVNSEIRVDDNKVTFVNLGYDDIVLTHSSTLNMLEIGYSDNMRDVVSGTTKVTEDDSMLMVSYVEVEYIQSDGNQDIYTGYINSLGFKGECKISEDVVRDEKFSSIMGTCGWIGSTPYRNYVSFYGNRIQFGYWKDYPYYSIGDQTKPHVFKLRTFSYDGYLEVDGVVKYRNTTYNFGTGPATEIILFSDLIGKAYYYKIWDVSGNLVRDYIPVVYHYGEDDAEAGLYDKVNDKFYGNAGSGTFTAGPVVSSGSE